MTYRYKRPSEILLKTLPGRKLALMLLLSGCLLSSGLAQAQPTGGGGCPLTPAQRGYVKWNPGHYIMIEGNNPALRMNSFIQDYRNVPSVKGVQKSYYWSEIETAPGVYDFSKIDADIAKLASAGKKLALIIGYKYQISDTQSSLPKYVLNQPNATVGSFAPSGFGISSTSSILESSLHVPSRSFAAIT